LRPRRALGQAGRLLEYFLQFFNQLWLQFEYSGDGFLQFIAPIGARSRRAFFASARKSGSMKRPYVFPPNTPKDRVQLLRKGDPAMQLAFER
jgi:hypothetical protein